MSWVRIDDQMVDHPKVVSLGAFGPLALALHLRALCWVSRYLTDGFIPQEALAPLLTGFDAWGTRLGGVSGMFSIDAAGDEFDWPSLMVQAGLWEQTKGGYRIHDYLAYNPARAQVLANREAARQRMAGRRNGSQPIRAKFGGTPSAVRDAPTPSPTPTPQAKSTPKGLKSAAGAAEREADS